MKLEWNLNNLLAVILLALILCGCQSKQTGIPYQSSANESDTSTISYSPTIEGFYIFKQNMSLKDVSKTLNERGIRFKLSDLNKHTTINYPLSSRWISAADLKKFKQIKVIEGYNLSILNERIKRFQIGFVSDTIFYFNYFNHLTSSPNAHEKGDLDFTMGVNSDLQLLTALSEGLKYKYGSPTERNGDGDLDAFNSKTPYYSDNNLKQYKDNEVWYSKDMDLEISLTNLCFRQSSPHKVEGITIIEVVFNENYAQQIQAFKSKKYDIQKKAEKNRKDSLTILKYMQFDSL